MQLVDDNLKEFENSTPRIVITSCEDVAMIDRTGEVDESIQNTTCYDSPRTPSQK